MRGTGAVGEAAEQLFGGTGSNQAITIGGVDRDGHDAVNELTYVILRATELMLLRDPNLNARYRHDVNTLKYLERLCLANTRTHATPAIHNDHAAIVALVAKGDSEQDARDYGVVGCVEPCSSGRHFGHSEALLVNLPSVLELTLFNGCHRHTGLDNRISEPTGDPTTFQSFEELQQAFLSQLDWMARQTVTVNNALGRAHQAFLPSPILSSLMEGPLDSGRDVIFIMLLKGIDVYACLFKEYRANLKDWTGDLEFTTEDGAVNATARVEKSDIEVLRHKVTNPTVLVEFKDAAALRRFLFAKKQDILDSMLRNEVRVTGNYNHVYRFGFLARDLEWRLLSAAA